MVVALYGVGWRGATSHEALGCSDLSHGWSLLLELCRRLDYGVILSDTEHMISLVETQLARTKMYTLCILQSTHYCVKLAT